MATEPHVDPAPPTAPSAPSLGRGLALAIALVCLAGIAVSAELTRIHVFVHTDPSYHSVCALSEGVNCETVAISPYAVFAGLPVSVWGVLGYLLIGALALWGATRWRLHPAWPLGLLLGLALVAALASLVLAAISAFTIDSLCLFCLASYALTALVLGLALWAARRSGGRAGALLRLDLQALGARPRRCALLAVLGGAALLALVLAVPAYWQTPGWRDLPQLAAGVDADGHHWIGAAAPRLSIVEFSDYECPHCRAAHKAMRMLAARHPTEIRLVHRHLPLDMACHPALRRPFHQRACLFARAAECAGLQGRFWDMNDALFAVQEKVKTPDVDPEELAVRLGLDRGAFRRCLDDGATAERIRGDLLEAMAHKLAGTPSFVVGERVFLGRIPEPELERLLAEAS